MYAIVAGVCNPEGLSWEQLGERPWERKDPGVKVTFCFYGPIPTERDAKRRVADELRKGADWMQFDRGDWLMDLTKFREAFGLDHEWLDGIVEVKPEFDIEPDTFNKTVMRGFLRLVLVPGELLARETLWGTYPASDVDGLLPLLKPDGWARDIVRLFDQAPPSRRSAVLFCDIDYFKKVNDGYGHEAGNVVLIGVAKVLRDIVGSRGAVYRYGGEELTVLLPDVDLDEAVATAKRVRLAVKALTFEAVPGLAVTVSIGVAVGDGGAESKVVVKAADQAMYAAKVAGRDRVHVAE